MGESRSLVPCSTVRKDKNRSTQREVQQQFVHNGSPAEQMIIYSSPKSKIVTIHCSRRYYLGIFVDNPVVFLAFSTVIVGYFAAAALIASLRRVINFLAGSTHLNATIWVEGFLTSA